MADDGHLAPCEVLLLESLQGKVVFKGVLLEVDASMTEVFFDGL